MKFFFYIEIEICFLEANGADIFEEVSKTIKSEATRPQQDTLRDRPAQDTEHILAEEQKPLFEVIHFIDNFRKKNIFFKIESR
jgi:hypothetical protein